MEYRSILISAGHSDSDPGATSSGYKEATLALSIRDKVFDALRGPRFGVPVQALVRDGQEKRNASLSTAITLSKKVSGPKVEFHFNSGPPKAKGVEALSTPGNKPL